MPNKKNVTKIYEKFNKIKKGLLGKRIIVENFFSWLKKNKKINIRTEKNCNNFKSFVYLAALKLIGYKIDL